MVGRRCLQDGVGGDEGHVTSDSSERRFVQDDSGVEF